MVLGSVVSAEHGSPGVFGALKEPHHDGIVGDLDFREVCAVGPIMVLCLVLGVYPQPVIKSAQPDLNVVAEILKVRQDVHAERMQAASLAQNR